MNEKLIFDSIEFVIDTQNELYAEVPGLRVRTGHRLAKGSI